MRPILLRHACATSAHIAMLKLPCLQEIVTAVFCKYAFSCACQSLRKQGWTGRVIRPCAPHEAWPVFPIPSSTYMHIDLASITSRHVALVPSVWCASLSLCTNMALQPPCRTSQRTPLLRPLLQATKRTLARGRSLLVKQRALVMPASP